MVDERGLYALSKQDKGLDNYSNNYAQRKSTGSEGPPLIIFIRRAALMLKVAVITFSADLRSVGR